LASPNNGSRSAGSVRPGASIDIRLSLAGSGRSQHAYDLAGLRLISDMPIGQLAPFAAFPAPSGSSPISEPVGVDGGTRLYAGSGWVGGRLRRVESWRAGGGYLLKIEGAGEFEISADGARVGRRRPLEGEVPGEEVTAAVLGPCLVLALALRGIWCLHASAAGARGWAVALAGESGHGKSTLAAALATAGSGWRRIADDLLPVKLERGAARVLPRYPQPGAVALSQALAGERQTLSLAAVYLLEPGASAVEVHELTKRRAAEALVRQTMAARLFDAELQARHLEFCVDTARRLPVRGLRFPRRPETLPSMTAAIGAACG
jgi:hypothetical protein